MTFYMLSEYEENLIKIHKRLHQAKKHQVEKYFEILLVIILLKLQQNLRQ